MMQRAMAGNDYLRLKLSDPVEASEPVLDRADPDDGCHSHEHQIRCEHDLLIEGVDDQVTGRVSRANLDQLDLSGTDVELELAVEGQRRRGHLDVTEVVGRKHSRV